MKERNTYLSSASVKKQGRTAYYKMLESAVKFRNKVGMDVCSEIINNYLERPDRNLSKLMDYARKLRVGTSQQLQESAKIRVNECEYTKNWKNVFADVCIFYF